MLRALGVAHELVQFAFPGQHHCVERLAVAKIACLQAGGDVRDPHAVAVELDARVVAFVPRARAEPDPDPLDTDIRQLAPAVEHAPGAPRLLAGNERAALRPALIPDGDMAQDSLQRVTVHDRFLAVLIAHTHDHAAQRDGGEEVRSGSAPDRLHRPRRLVAEAVEASDADDAAGVLDARHFIGQQERHRAGILVALREQALLPRAQQVAVATDAGIRVVGRPVRGKDGMTADGLMPHAVLARASRIEHIAQVGGGKGGEMSNTRGASASLLVGVALGEDTIKTFRIKAPPVVAAEEEKRPVAREHGLDALDGALLARRLRFAGAFALFPRRSKGSAVGVDAGQVGQRALVDGEADLGALASGLARGVEAVLQELTHDGFGLAVPLRHGQRGEALRLSSRGEDELGVHLSPCSHRISRRWRSGCGRAGSLQQSARSWGRSGRGSRSRRRSPIRDGSGAP